MSTEFEDSDKDPAEWCLWITKRDDAGEPFDMWNYDANIGDLYSVRLSGYADEPGTAPSENDTRWFWEIYWGASGGARTEMLEGQASSRGAAKQACIDALLQQTLSIFKGTGDLLQGALPDQLVDDDDLGDFDWKLSVEPALDGDEDHDSWCYGITHSWSCRSGVDGRGAHGEFYLSLELLVEKGTRPISLEQGEWRWWVIDETDTLVEGTAPSRTRARQMCVAALLDHLAEVCAIAELLCSQALPSHESESLERPFHYEHDEARLDPNYAPLKSEHPATVEILRAVEVGASADSVLLTVHKFCSPLATDDLRAAIEIHQTRCPSSNCPVLAAMRAFVAARESK